MNAPLGTLDPERFLAEYWQQKPCLLRQAFPRLDFPLDGNDLAGLACEPLAEARIIRGPDASGAWSLDHGPFDEGAFDDIGDRDWTLLVQDVEKHFPPLRSLLDLFNFLPRWRLDDLMVSFAAPGGSVGAHVDQYDVFLLQVEGRRQWDIARDFDPTLRDDAPINMLADFHAEERWILEPGDMLYLPPNVAHHGVALDPCLTASIGFRAPSAADLALALGEWLGDQADEGGRYGDPGLGLSSENGEVDAEATERFRTLLRNPLEDPDAFPDLLGRFLSRFRQAHEPIPAPGPVDLESLENALDRGDSLALHPWARLNWRRHDGQARLFVSGQAWDCSPALASWLCAGAQEAQKPPLDPTDRRVLVRLLEAGQLLLHTVE